MDTTSKSTGRRGRPRKQRTVQETRADIAAAARVHAMVKAYVEARLGRDVLFEVDGDWHIASVSPTGKVLVCWPEGTPTTNDEFTLELTSSDLNDPGAGIKAHLAKQDQDIALMRELRRMYPYVDID